jgi:hypothetical protein
MTMLVPDEKLLHLVKKIVLRSDTETEASAEQATTSLPSTQFVVTRLRTNHREYLRIRDLAQFTKLVERAMQIVADRDSLSRLEDASYEAAAQAEDEARAQLPAGGGLNETLRNRYQQVSLSLGNKVSDSASKLIRAQSALSMADATQSSSSDVESHRDGEAQIDEALEEAEERQFVSNGSTEKAKRSSVDDVSVGRSGRKRKRNYSGTKGNPSRQDGSRHAGANEGMNDDFLGERSKPLFLLPVPRPVERYADLGGLSQVIQQLRQIIEYPILRPELYIHLGVDPPRGVLLRGTRSYASSV